jgi:uncharacterized protein (DUF2345 family)
MQDDVDGSRIRFKTAEGHQIIFDDTNERIYMSTAKGKSWIELDQDGRIHVFGSDSISVRSGKDINFTADQDINFEAERSINMRAINGNIKIGTGGSIHVKALKDIKQSACGIFDIDSESSIKMTAASNLDILSSADMAITGASALNLKSGGDITETAANIHLNGPGARDASPASCPEQPDQPTTVPGHEPWKGRLKSAQTRNKHWKE